MAPSLATREGAVARLVGRTGAGKGDEPASNGKLGMAPCLATGEIDSTQHTRPGLARTISLVSERFTNERQLGMNQRKHHVDAVVRRLRLVASKRAGPRPTPTAPRRPPASGAGRTPPGRVPG
jgi:hypothetical protein